MYVQFPITASVFNIAIAASTSSNSAALPKGNFANSARISVPPGGVDCWIAFGIGAAVTVTIPTAGGGTANGIHVAAGLFDVMTIPGGATHISVITLTGTTTLYLMQSQGR